MKKFISMVMAAAMVVSMVPATAFAGVNYSATGTATFKMVDAQDIKKADAKTTVAIDGPELQIKLTDVSGKTGAASLNEFEVTLDFTGAEALADTKVVDFKSTSKSDKATVTLAEDVTKGDSTIELKITEKDASKRLAKDDLIVIPVKDLNVGLTRVGAGSTAKVEVSGALGKSEALTFATVVGEGIKVALAKVAEVTEGEVTPLEKSMEIKPMVGSFKSGQKFEIRVNNGFGLIPGTDGTGYSVAKGSDDDRVIVTLSGDADKVKIDKASIKIEAISAKVDSVAKLTVKAINTDKDGNVIAGHIKGTADAVEAAKVIGAEVLLKVDADADVPVIYSGVNVANKGITDDSEHKTLEITLKESAKGALDVKKAFKLTLPEGVFATQVDVTAYEGAYDNASEKEYDDTAIENLFKAAYKKGEQETFEFARKTFMDTTAKAAQKDMEIKFEMKLIAVPGFTGDVTLKLEGDAFEKAQEVVIAKFVSPYTVEAQSNDLVIDYRNTAVPTDVVIKEAEAGLWAKDLAFNFAFDKSVIDLEDDAKITADAESGMKLKDVKDMSFKVKEESDDVAATVTISDISLYMGRSIAAGAYHLKMGTSAGYAMMTTDGLFTDAEGAWTAKKVDGKVIYTAADFADWAIKNDTADAKEPFTAKLATVKEGFVNVVTAGRDKDDASFTTKVVVPVGEAYIVAGENQIALDVPAYINAAGYTMLPVRAVATALGINNDNVIWSQAARQVTILYGQRIITMTVGESMVYVNGSAIPASAAVEITNGRAFLGLRDLANALGVTTIDWNNETKTATLN